MNIVGTVCAFLLPQDGGKPVSGEPHAVECQCVPESYCGYRGVDTVTMHILITGISCTMHTHATSCGKRWHQCKRFLHH